MRALLSCVTSITQFLKYEYSAVGILPPAIPGVQPVVSDMLAAFFSNLAPNQVAQYSLHLPKGVEQNVLADDCFSTNSSLRPGLKLLHLAGINSDDLHPLIILKQGIKPLQNKAIISASKRTRLKSMISSIFLSS